MKDEDDMKPGQRIALATELRPGDVDVDDGDVVVEVGSPFHGSVPVMWESLSSPLMYTVDTQFILRAPHWAEIVLRRFEADLRATGQDALAEGLAQRVAEARP